MTEKLLRTFLAVPVPRDVSSKKNMLYSTLENVDGDINWVKNAQLHLTMKFLGHTPESAIIDVIDHVEKITLNMNPFDLKIEETGCFPVPTRPRILWLGLKGNLDLLKSMVESIENVLEPLGFPKDSRDILPHITLARIKYPQKHTPNVDPFLKSSYDPIDFPVDRMQFFSSELLPSGAVHTILKTFPLGESL
ncbi:MAG TPA: RNA 2',3'-cyclic phosphodiesterase [Candidatus Marinimicrobia bacterium]|nr:RNA 2',3'-cyclic phosphodiesterase [Candidatus Neomarinimicrobiota bacterium]